MENKLTQKEKDNQIPKNFEQSTDYKCKCYPNCGKCLLDDKPCIKKGFTCWFGSEVNRD